MKNVSLNVSNINTNTKKVTPKTKVLKGKNIACEAENPEKYKESYK
jgi:hypothetical protein